MANFFNKIMDNTVYIVSGFMRTGTSMMMKALEAGGLKAEYKQSRDEMKERYADEHYDPNIGGLYELERKDYQTLNFPYKYRGKLIKCLGMGVAHSDVMPDAQIKVVLMRRDEEEIRQSYEAFFGQPLRHIEIDKILDKSYRILDSRVDVEVIQLEFRDVINSPLETFLHLVDKGWPINPQTAASIIEPKYYRFRKEQLTKGVADG